MFSDVTSHELAAWLAVACVVLALARVGVRRLGRWLAANEARAEGDTLIQCVVCRRYKPKRELVPYTDAFQRAAFRCTENCRQPRRAA